MIKIDSIWFGSVGSVGFSYFLTPLADTGRGSLKNNSLSLRDIDKVCVYYVLFRPYFVGFYWVYCCLLVLVMTSYDCCSLVNFHLDTFLLLFINTNLFIFNFFQLPLDEKSNKELIFMMNTSSKGFHLVRTLI